MEKDTCCASLVKSVGAERSAFFSRAERAAAFARWNERRVASRSATWKKLSNAPTAANDASDNAALAFAARSRVERVVVRAISKPRSRATRLVSLQLRASAILAALVFVAIAAPRPARRSLLQCAQRASEPLFSIVAALPASSTLRFRAAKTAVLIRSLVAQSVAPHAPSISAQEFACKSSVLIAQTVARKRRGRLATASAFSPSRLNALRIAWRTLSQPARRAA